MLGKLAAVRPFATKLKGGSIKSKPDSAGRRLGVKRFEGEEVQENEIVARQRGFQWTPGQFVHYGKDHTLHASVEGRVKFSRQKNVNLRKKVYMTIVPKENPNRKFFHPPSFVYHPELYPELAGNNPEPTNYEIRRSKRSPRAHLKAPRDPQQLKASLVENP